MRSSAGFFQLERACSWLYEARGALSLAIYLSSSCCWGGDCMPPAPGPYGSGGEVRWAGRGRVVGEADAGERNEQHECA